MRSVTRRGCPAGATATLIVLMPCALLAQGPGALTPPRGAPAAPAAPTRPAASTPAVPAPATSAPPADRAPRVPQARIGDDYLMQVGDKLRIEVYKDAQLSQSVQIRPDGKVTLPLIGDIAATGLTPIALRDQITTSLRDYVNNPVVTVIVVEGTAPTAYVVGEVNHPGMVTLQSDMTVLQALAVAGGLKDFADTKNIRILRKKGTGTETISFNYKDALKGTGGSMVYLQPGDTVVVPD
jgi:polysaccharide export outer membrane protein